MRMKVLLMLGAATLLALSQAAAVEPNRVLPVNQTPVERTIVRGPDTMLLQSPNQSNGIFTDIGCDLCGTGVQIVADNFDVATGGLGFDLDEIWVWGGYYSSDTPVLAPFDIYIAANAAGSPGAAICSQTGVWPTSDVTTGVVLFGVSEHLIQLNIPACNLADGTYWVYLFTNTGFGTDDFFWEVGNVDAANGIVGSAWATENPPATWNLDAATDMACQITGTIVPVELQSFDIE